MFTPTFTSLLCISVLPGVFLLLFTYFLDRVEKEPLKLLLWVFFLGFVFIPPIAMFLENLLSGIATGMVSGLALVFFCNAVSPAVVEESLKYSVIRKYIWNHPEFNEHFDGVVYAVYVSMGFAIAENLLYVFSSGMEVGLVRAVLSIPGHFLFAVTMGFFFAMAKFHSKQRGIYTVASLVCPMVLHACYNGAVTCADAENLQLPIDIISAWLVIILDCVLMWVLGIWCIRCMRHLSQDDPPALRQQADQAFKNTRIKEFDPAFRDPMAQSSSSWHHADPCLTNPTPASPSSQYPSSQYSSSQYPAASSSQYPMVQYPTYRSFQPMNRQKSGCLSWLGWFFLIGFALTMFGSMFSVENIERLQFEALVKKYGPVETELQRDWTEKYAQYEQKALTDEAWVQWLKTEYLPTWTDLREKLNELRIFKESEYKRVKKLVSGRIDYTNAFIRAVEEQSDQIAREAVHQRIQTEYIEPVQFSLENGVSVSQTQLNEALRYSAVIGDQDLSAFFLERGADILSRDEDEKTTSEIAAEHGHDKLAQFLNEKLLQKQQEQKEREEAEMLEELEEQREREAQEEQEETARQKEREERENASDDENEADSDSATDSDPDFSSNSSSTLNSEGRAGTDTQKSHSDQAGTAPLSLPWEANEEKDLDE